MKEFADMLWSTGVIWLLTIISFQLEAIRKALARLSKGGE